MTEGKKDSPPPTSEAVKSLKPLVEPSEETPPTSEAVEDEKPPSISPRSFWSWSKPQRMQVERKKNCNPRQNLLPKISDEEIEQVVNDSLSAMFEETVFISQDRTVPVTAIDPQFYVS